VPVSLAIGEVTEPKKKRKFRGWKDNSGLSDGSLDELEPPATAFVTGVCELEAFSLFRVY